MISWLTWPVDWLVQFFIGWRVRKIKKALEQEEARFVDAKEWAKLNHISAEKAERELERGVKSGILEKMFLYEGSDSPITFVVPETRLDKPVWLSELGDFSEEADREVLVSSFRSRPVYVAAGK